MARRRRNSADHVLFGGAIGEVAWCTRCGKGLRMGLPVLVDVLVAAGKAFSKAHRDCPDTGHLEPVPKAPDEWIAGRDVGVSSATIWSVMTGKPSPLDRYDTPKDGADFGRCFRLLAHFPEWRPRLGEVADKYPAWRHIVDHWDERAAMQEPDPDSPFQVRVVNAG